MSQSRMIRVLLGWAALLLLLILICAVAPLADAQLSTTSINGAVRDATGSVIPDVTIILRNVNTSVEKSVTTNQAGIYAFLNVQPGAYTLEAGKTGFSTRQTEPFQLAVNQTSTFDFGLNLGAVSERINVEASAAEVQSSTSELGAVVSQKAVLDLPLNGRNFTQLLALTPGVAPVSVSQNAGGSFNASPTGGNFNFPSINGQTNRSNFFMTDGIMNMETFNSGYVVPPIVDSIQEFKVQSHNDQAEFGMTLGGTINVVTKSGTNDLHGSAWEFLRNDFFDARNTFLPSRTALRQNQFGATAGGPVILPKLYNGRNHTFFYVAYQGWRFRQPSSTFYRVPTAANLQGDLRDWPLPIYNPFTTRPDPSKPGAFIRDPFPNNQIPANLINPGALLYAKTTLPAPIFTGVADRNALDATPIQQNQEEYSARLDQTLGSKDFFWFRYSGVLFNVSQSGGRQSLASLRDNRAKDYGVSWVHTFGPTSTLQAQFGRAFTEQNTITRFRSVPANFVKDVGWDPNWAGGYTNNASVVPAFNVTNFFSGNEGDNLQTPTQVWQYKANFSKIHGSHTFKMGAELNTMNIVGIFHYATSTFAAPQTGDPQNLGNTGSPLASYLLNVPDSAGKRNTLQETRWGGVMGIYFSDQWKATRNLTVNMGLRYDRTFIPPYGKQIDIPGGKETGNYNLQTGTYIVQTLPPPCEVRGHSPCIPGRKLPDHVVVSPNDSLVKDSTRNFQPRFGLAYRLNDKTALRAGFGTVFDNWAGVEQTTTNSFGLWPDVAILNGQNLNVPTSASPTPTVTGTNPIPNSAFPAPTPFQTIGWFFDPNLQNPYSMQWNLGVQHQFNTSTKLDLSYVGSGSRRLDIGGTYNTALTPGPGDPAPRRPFPYITPTFYDRSWGRSSYQALQFQLDKRISSGFSYVVSYTWSKAISLACDGWFGVEGCAVQDPYHFNNERSIAGFDLTHVLTANWIYELPIGKGKLLQTGSRAADYILGNWQINGIMSLRSGLPYTVVVSGDIANTGNTGNFMRPNLVGDPNISNPTRARWFNTSAFAAPAAFTYGNVGRNTMRSDWLKNLDFSLFRQFPFGEAKMVELRVESFNIFNTPVYSSPVSNRSDPNFGAVLSTQNKARQVQLGLKISF